MEGRLPALPQLDFVLGKHHPPPTPPYRVCDELLSQLLDPS